jgi:hypothetical protein
VIHLIAVAPAVSDECARLVEVALIDAHKLTGLDPSGDVVHLAVLPRPKPEQKESHVALSCAGQQGVDAGEIEVTFFRLSLFPVDRYLEAISVQELERLESRPGFGVVVTA